MTLIVDLQIADDTSADSVPPLEQFSAWVNEASAGLLTDELEYELTVRVVDEIEGTALNEQYRNQRGSTNVLSFPFEAPEGVDLPLLGDLVICAPVVAREADEQHKSLQAHWAHLVVHGVLHLLGHDHIEQQQAEEMERLEVAVLARLGFSDPYQAQEQYERRTS